MMRREVRLKALVGALVGLHFSGCAVTTNDVKERASGESAPGAMRPSDSRADARRIVGVWELVRYDNIPRSEIPPGGLVNLIYVFLPDGRMEHFLPGRRGEPYGRGNTPFERYIPFVLEADRLRGWLGLTNDLDEDSAIAFTGGDAFEVTFRDGSIASFARLHVDEARANEIEPRCVPFTVAGHGYDAASVRELKSRLAAPAAPGERDRLLGMWHLPADGGQGKPASIELSADGSFVRTDWIGTHPYRSGGRFAIHNGVLTIHDADGNCHQSLALLDGERLELRTTPEASLSLWRSESDVKASPTTVAGAYAFNIVNESADPIEGVELHEPRVTERRIAPHGTSGFMHLRTLLPTEVRASWHRRGVARSAGVDLASALPVDRKVAGITVVISERDTVSLRFELEDGSVLVPGEGRAAARLREAAERYRAALIAGDEATALVALKQIGCRRPKSYFAVDPVLLAAAHGALGVLQAALRSGCNPNGARQGSPLVAAASTGKLEVVRALVEARAQVNPYNADAGSALQQAADDGHTEIVRYLLVHGADPNLERYGQIPLAGAIRSKSTAIARLLLDAGADPHKPFLEQSLIVFARQMRAPDDLITLLEAASASSPRTR